MVKRRTKFVLLSIAAALLVQLVVPIFGFDARVEAYSKISATSASSVDKIAYMGVVEWCLGGDYSLSSNVNIGDSITSIMQFPNNEYFVGPAISGTYTKTDGTAGWIRCKDALTGLVGNIKITSDMLGASKTDILSNVYNKSSLQLKTIRCNYYILNWGENGFTTDVIRDPSTGKPRQFTWPQGYVGASGTNKGEDKTNAAPITVLYNDEGFVDIEPKNEAISSQFTDGGTYQHVFSDDKVEKYCGRIIKKIHPYNTYSSGVNEITGKEVWYGDGISYNDSDDKPFGEWGWAFRDGNNAFLIYKDDWETNWNDRFNGYTYSSGTKDVDMRYDLNVDPNNTASKRAVQNLLGNLRELFFTQLSGVGDVRSIDAMTYLEKKDGLAYLFYGRYLFNGDGKLPYSSTNGGCGALTVLNDDKVDKLPLDKWNYTLPYVANTRAYGNSSDSSKTEYLSSWAGANNNKKVEIALYPGEAWKKYDCEEIAAKFNAAVTSLGSVKTKVLGYMNVATVNEDGSITMPDGTVVETPGVAPGVTDPASTEAEEPPKTCQSGGGALGWILCPLLDALGKATDFFYTKVIEPFLQVNTNLFTNTAGGGNAVFKAWTIFQTIANVVFIILLLVVIFSQVTGAGIDNYGIKRILPKLIIAAILINLSYIICQLAVDVSNILGYGLRAFFQSISSSIPLTINGETVGVGASIITTLIAVLIGSVGIAMIFANGAAILLPLVLGLVSAAIGVIFLFVLLSVRQAGVVLLVVLSPLAFVCYTLPNTKTLFDRWRKMLVGLLLFFPICGMLIGAGDLASRILLSVNPDDFFMALTALIMSIVPFFLLPTLLKASFAAMGNIGAKISGVGASLNKGVVGKTKNSNLYKDAYAKMAAGKSGGLREKIAGKTGIGKRGLARNRAAYLKGQREDAAASNLVGGTGYAAAMARQETDTEREELDNEMALINKKTNKGEEKDKLYAEYDQAVASGDVVRARAIAEIAGRRKDTASDFTAKMKKDVENGKYKGRSDVLKAVSKQISTGDNSKQYRAADALAFEYASQFNRGDTTQDYQDWVRDGKNAKKAVENHITNGQELYGQSSKVLGELNDLAKEGKVDGAYLANLAGRAQAEALQTGVYDQTKEDNMAEFQGFMSVVNSEGKEVSASQAQRDAQNAARAAQQAQQDMVLDVQRQALHTTHEQIAREQGATAGIFQGKSIYRTPTGFNAVRRDKIGGDLILVNERGEKWNANKGRYMK